MTAYQPVEPRTMWLNFVSQHDLDLSRNFFCDLTSANQGNNLWLDLDLQEMTCYQRKSSLKL
jgi:hypothetical protein